MACPISYYNCIGTVLQWRTYMQTENNNPKDYPTVK